MMKLLKYDFKRNAALILGVTVVLILAQLSMLLFMNDVERRMGLGIFAYIIAGVILFITPIRTFKYNLQSYHRKLLPVHTLKTIFSPIIMGTLSLVVLCFIVVIHAFIYLYAQDGLQIVWDQISKYPSDIILSLLSMLWIILSLFITIFLAITIAASIRIKGSFWIGIVCFFLIVNAISWINTKLFDGYEVGLFGIFASDTSSNSVYYSGEFIGSMVFELLCSVVFVYIMMKLIDRKVEV
ncbi:hypothetical protein [Paenibacillus crassostreae]|uniref:Uncharacterized protein n=1 Tax=Paenibacillus crassostreae TaxID=1763538 RepID=A0A167G2H2_9BACL|nr:hypothetical protein [Paenibacillus crassostreae]AOZ93825.1 hypothetical protein LPB68_17655 [Paenibacillus crassostreae]OAB77142.1 hypothetical protein PNBC_07080 [Paenibacillus crassostreae]